MCNGTKTFLKFSVSKSEFYTKDEDAVFSGRGFIFISIPAGNYMFQVNNRNTRTRCEIC